MSSMNSYDLSRGFINFAFDNPEKISPNHYAIYFFAIEHCNRLGWKCKFGLPTMMVCDAVGIKKPQTFIKYFNDLEDWGFIKVVERSRNQYSANIISLISATPKKGEAMDKAMVNHAAKHGASKGQSNSPIDKQVNKETSILIKSVLTPPNGVDSLYFYLAKGYHKMFYDYKGSKSLENAQLESWINIIRLLIEVDKVTVPQLIAVKLFLQAGINKDRGVDSFWSDTIYSLNALRKKSKDGVYSFDRIKLAAKNWLNKNPEQEASVYQSEKNLMERVNG
jgi:hypothetical protein